MPSEPQNIPSKEQMLDDLKSTHKMLEGDFKATIEPVAKQESPKSSIYWALVHAIDHCNELSKTERSRELSLVITKLEEAQMWYERIYPPKTL